MPTNVSGNNDVATQQESCDRGNSSDAREADADQHCHQALHQSAQQGPAMHSSADADVEQGKRSGGSHISHSSDNIGWAQSKGGSGGCNDGGHAAVGGKQKTLLSSALPKDSQLVLEFRHVSCWVPSSWQKPSLLNRAWQAIGRTRQKRQDGGTRGGDGPRAEQRRVLHAVSGHVIPGQVLALMGPSGSGKTSLLSIVGGRASQLVTFEGQVLVNGLPLTKARRRRIGFVLQDDVLYETLTVQETLTYAGLLRMPRAMTRAVKLARVDAVIEALGLQRSRHTLIGGFFRRGISGGERKRVSVGHELLIDPAILMLDEPTSGLDATTALHLVTMLKELAEGGRAIITTIHQPASRLYRQLDRVMLLAEGRCMYYGRADKAVDWFEHFGFILSLGISTPDFITDVAMGEVPGGGQLSGSTAVTRLCTTFADWYVHHPQGYDGDVQLSGVQLLPEADLPDVVTCDASTPRRRQETASKPADRERRLGSSGLGPLQQPHDVSGNDASSGYLDTLRHSFLSCVMQYCVLPLRAHAGEGSTAGDAAHTAASVAFESSSQAWKQRPAAVAGKPAAVAAQTKEVPGMPVGRSSSWPATGSTRSCDPHHGVGLQPGRVPVQQCELQGQLGGPCAAVPSSMGDSADGREGANYMEQVVLLTSRSIKVRRFESLSGQEFVQIVAVAVIGALMWWQRGRAGTLAAMSDIMGLLFFSIMFPSFRSLMSALFTFPSEFRILSKERPSGLYRLSSYYLARSVSDLPVELAYPLVFVVILYWGGGLQATAGAFISYTAALLLLVLVAQSWGLLLGSAFMDPKLAQTVTTVIMLTFVLICGYYVRDVPNFIGWLKYFSMFYWGNQLLLKIQLHGISLLDCGEHNNRHESCVPVPDVRSALRLGFDPSASVWLEIVVLFVMLFALRIVTYMVLRHKTAARGTTD